MDRNLTANSNNIGKTHRFSGTTTVRHKRHRHKDPLCVVQMTSPDDGLTGAASPSELRLYFPKFDRQYFDVNDAEGTDDRLLRHRFFRQRASRLSRIAVPQGSCH